MKFTSAILALVAASDSEAPVISLDLASFKHSDKSYFNKKIGAGPHAGRAVNYSKNRGANHQDGTPRARVTPAAHNEFADECEVFQNSAKNCAEPKATAYDHHDGELTSKISTTYRLFVESKPRKNPMHVERVAKGISRKTRGEWIIDYNVADADGNKAETLTFALILVDTQAPNCHKSTISPACQTTKGCAITGSQAKCANGVYRQNNGKGHMNLELCGQDGNNMFIWAPKQFTYDNYDGLLNAKNSAMQVRFNGAANNGYVTKSLYAAKSSAITVKYEIDSEDFADIFGKNNKNNMRQERGTITMDDTIIPTILNGNFVGRYECGYTLNIRGIKEPQHKGYTDCYDDWAHKNNKNHVEITIDGKIFGSTAVYPGTVSKATVNIFGQGLRNYGQKGAHTIVWNVSDKFGNKAKTVTKKIQITDTIPPTLYITKKDARKTKKLQGDDCHRTHAAKWSAGNKGDYTNAECEFEHDDSHETFAHKNLNTDKNSHVVGESVHVDDPMATEMVIQHSAGYAEDYKFVEELMQEGTGYSCMDECSKTTTTVAWKNSCSSNGAGSEFNMLKPGTYFLKYTCSDGQHQTTACRTFINVDKTRPVITCLECANHNDGTWHVEASRDNNYVDAGATCSDMVDGNISQDVEVSGDVVNMAAVGTYKINYNCEDSAGQTAFPATRTVIVEDKTCPTCVIPGGEELITVEASFPYTEEKSSCTDTLDGEMPSASVYGKVDVELTGTYVLTYSVTDKNGNGADPKKCKGTNSDHRHATHFTKTIVVEDTMVPIISLSYKGSKLMAESTTSTVNGWVIGAVASAVSGVALLGYAATRKATVATSVPV
jgi:hypothetical protein